MRRCRRAALLALILLVSGPTTAIVWAQAPTPDRTVTANTNYELGLRVKSAVDATLIGLRFWKAAGEGTGHVGHVWTTSGQLLRTAVFLNETASGWQEQALSEPLPLRAHTVYVVSVNSTNGRYVATLRGFEGPVVSGALTAPSPNGLYGPSGLFPSSTRNTNYFRDVLVAFADESRGSLFSPVAISETDAVGPGAVLAWNSPATNFADLPPKYRLYVNGALVPLGLIECTSGSPHYRCHAALPTLSTGRHTLEMTAYWDVLGSPISESARSTPLIFDYDVTVASSPAPVLIVGFVPPQ